jgi:putative transposase
MDNHVHLVCTPSRDESLSATMQALGRRYVRWFNRRHGRTGTLWEGRFRSSLIEADRYLLACQRYVEMNPVRAGRVATPAAWPWSSHRHHVGLAVDPLVRTHPTVWALGNTPFDRESNYRRLFEEPASGSESAWIGERVASGRPLASDHFQQKLEDTKGMRLLPRQVGRPRRAA